MIAPASLTLQDALAKYLEKHWLAESSAGLYRIACALYQDWTGQPVLVHEVTASSVLDWMRWLAKTRAPQTVNSKRRQLLTIVRSVAEAPKVPRMREVRRVPTAWSMDDLQKLLRACDRARLWHVQHRRSWTPCHWRALILTCYDTSLRIGCLLSVSRSCCDLTRGTLLVPGELQKQRCDTLHRLHPQTCALIERLPKHDLLFPWPMRREQIWVWLGRILEDAGLPASRRDKFHKLRRTSYSLVYRELGPLAASRHAGHTTDMSDHYLDPTILGQPDPVDALPRP